MDQPDGGGRRAAGDRFWRDTNDPSVIVFITPLVIVFLTPLNFQKAISTYRTPSTYRLVIL